MYAAPHDATESRDALAARHATDRSTLERVAEALHGQLGGRNVVALLVRERVTSAGEPMERQAYVPLHHIRAGAR